MEAPALAGVRLAEVLQRRGCRTRYDGPVTSTHLVATSVGRSGNGVIASAGWGPFVTLN